MQHAREFILSKADASKVRELVPVSSIQQPIETKRMLLLVLAYAALLVAVLLLGTTFAADSSVTWTGQAVVVTRSSNGSEIRNTIDIKWTVSNSNKSAELRFEAPWSCTLKANRIGARNVSRYELRETAGGRCNALLNEVISITRYDDSNITMQFTSGKNVAGPVSLSIYK